MSSTNWDDIDLHNIGVPDKELTLEEWRKLFVGEWKLPENPWLYKTIQEEVEIFPCERLGKMNYADYPEWLQECMNKRPDHYQAIFTVPTRPVTWFFVCPERPLVLSENYLLVRHGDGKINLCTNLEVMRLYKKVLP